MFGLEIIQSLLEGKIEEVAENLVIGLIKETPIGAGLEAYERVSMLGETGGMSEIDKLINQVKPELPSLHGPAFFQKLEGLANDAFKIKSSRSRDRRDPAWVRAGWAKSRQDWLNESWRHDWRSQPRDTLGRWIPGRLDYPVMGAPHKGSTWGVSRRGRQMLARKRLKNRYRKAGRNLARGFVSSWGRDGN